MKPQIYLETSIFNYYFLNDPKREMEILDTKKLFKEIEKGEFEPFISGVVIDEIEKCEEEEKRERMLALIPRYNISRVPREDPREYEELAEKYILTGAIPARKRGDALHISIATLGGIEILLSWNCEHIVRFKTQQIVKAINVSFGLNDIAINTPREVISHEQKLF